MTLARRSLLKGGAAFVGVALARASRAVPAITGSSRVESLLRQMTLEEKVGQLTIYPDAVRPTPRPINPDMDAARKAAEERQFQLAEIKAGRVGALLAGTGVALGRELQKNALSSRLGVPLLFGADVLHGLRTIFPIPLALAASFQPDLAERTARAAAVEMSAVGVHWTYAPMIDVARDQRWGRVAEGSGEDVFLTSVFAAAYVRGFQGRDLRSPDSVLATPKHFAGYGAVLGGLEYNATELSERELRETFLPPFKAAIDAGALTIMSAFTDVDGVPSSGNRRLLTDILRGEWDFRGFVVSDALSVEELVAHGVAATEDDAALLALTAGLDMSMGSGLYVRALPKLVASGRLPEHKIDTAVRRILMVKEAIGLFDNPYRSLDPRRETQDIRTASHLQLAKEAALNSAVLLQNTNGILPLRSNARIALIGPLADDPANLDGPWAPWARTGEGVTLAASLRAKLMPNELTVVPGSAIDATLPGGIEAALAAARQSDIVVLAVGEAQTMSGEAQARSDIVLPHAQEALVAAVMTVRKPVIVVLSTGRALALSPDVRRADAILVSWFLGSQSGPALADLLFGIASPCGRLPVSFPQVSGQEPYFYNHKHTGREEKQGDFPAFKARYRDVSNTPAFAFGHGLTYSQMRYGATQVEPFESDATIVHAVIENHGPRSAVEVVQLYVSQRVGSVTRPVRQLKGFQRIRLEAGEQREVRFRLERDVLTMINSDLKSVVEPGQFDVWIAPSALSGTPASLTLT